MFVNLMMTKEQLQEVEEVGHRLILFYVSEEVDARGLPVYIAVASGDCAHALSGVATAHLCQCGREKGVRGYVVHELEEVKKGMALGSQELKAGDN